MLRALPNAVRTVEYGMPAWLSKRPPGARMPAMGGTMDPSVTFVGLAERKSGLTLYFWWLGSEDGFGASRAKLETAGFRVMVGCLAFNRRSEPWPVEPVAEMLANVAKADRDASKGAPWPASPTKLPPVPKGDSVARAKARAAAIDASSAKPKKPAASRKR